MIVPFDPDAHLGDVNAWHLAQGVAPVTPEMLPRVGFIVEGVAAGWLYQTDSAVALIENFVTNPDAPARARWAAVGELGQAIEAHARNLGVRRLLTMTKSLAIGRIAIRNGGTYRGPFHLLTKEI